MITLNSGYIYKKKIRKKRQAEEPICYFTDKPFSFYFALLFFFRCSLWRNGFSFGPWRRRFSSGSSGTPEHGQSRRRWRWGRRRSGRSGGRWTAKCTRSATTCRHVSASWSPEKTFPTSAASSSENNSCAELASFLRNPLVLYSFSRFSVIYLFILYLYFVWDNIVLLRRIVQHRI